MREKLALKKRGTGYLAAFQLAKKQLQAADRNRGTPSLRTGEDQFGTPVLIKTWPRVPDVDDSDLREIWRNETRQLHRLAGNRGVGDYIAQLLDAAVDDGGFYLVINAGQRVPLGIVVERNDGLQYANRRSVRGRRLVWANLLRVAKGIDLLHLQGMLHRNVSLWSILTADVAEPDFQLTGFEWSMRIVGLETLPPKLAKSISGERQSFLLDWHGLGKIAVQLLEANTQRIGNLGIPSHEVAEYLTAAEARLLRQLLQVITSERLDGKTVCGHIEKIIFALDAAIQSEEVVYNLVLSIGPNGQLSEVIRAASENEIEIDDENSQLTFVSNDLANPILLLLRDDRLALRGQRLTYYLADFKRTRDRIPSNWEIAFCGSASVTNRATANPINSMPLVSNSLRLTPQSMSATAFRGRPRGTAWTIARQQLNPPRDEDPEESRVRKSLALAQMLDYAFAATDAFPVRAELLPSQNGDTQYRIRVVPAVEQGRDQLSSALELKDPPAKRFVDALTGDRQSDDRTVSWILSDTAAIGERSDSSTEWQFVAVETMPNGAESYIFSGEALPHIASQVYLLPGDSAGRDIQLERRLRSLAALGDHAELTRMLVDPRRRIVDSGEVAVEDKGFCGLDHSKQDAFRSIVKTLPLFLVQGPPGVGKTRLVRELVRQQLSLDSSIRILLTAQSNHAVDHLMHEVVNALDEAEISAGVVVVRCVPAEKKDADSRFDVSTQSIKLLQGLLKSKLFETASANLRSRLAALADLYGIEEVSGARGVPSPNARRALETLLLRSANLLFATANSSEIQVLIDERSHFDWAIVEEAGKATGGELVAPLLLSSRRLMIGDHQQLPPFGEERVLTLLNRPTAVRKAVNIVNGLISRGLRDATVDEVFGDMQSNGSEVDENELVRMCEDAARSFSLFQSMIEREYRRIETGGAGRPIAAQLSKQHRMHPSIASIVSHAFYTEKLKTDESAAEKFRSKKCPISWATGSGLPEQPVLWVDMPWVQDKIRMRRGESFPRYTNPLEQRAVHKILGHARAEVGHPTLTVLSPYARQVRSLGQLIAREQQITLSNLHQFCLPTGQKAWCNTVDSFQGSEADFVVVSLVRNNGFGSVRAALGFLADARRMNVLVSRARWRLVVVGSLAFLKNVLSNPRDQDGEDLIFLDKLISFFDGRKSADGVAVVRAEELGWFK
jgi:hypothetical protein